MQNIIHNVIINCWELAYNFLTKKAEITEKDPQPKEALSS